MPDTVGAYETLAMDAVLAAVRAVGENTRLRLIFTLRQGEFNVTELTRILCQSQPRISRHLKLMLSAGLLERYKEGSWVVFRLAETGVPGQLAKAIADLLPRDDKVLHADLDRLNMVLRERRQAAEDYFSANAADWDRIRSLHVAEDEVETAMLNVLAGHKFKTLLDLGTGTGQVLRLLRDRVETGIGIDQSRGMLALARERLHAAGADHLQARHGDIYKLTQDDETFDLVTIHQVLHYLDDAASALREAARVMTPGALLLIADFAPHTHEFLRESHAHRRLGIATDVMDGWLRGAGLALIRREHLPPPPSIRDGLVVTLWLAAKPEWQGAQ